MTMKYISLVSQEYYIYVYAFSSWIIYIFHSLRRVSNVPEVMERDLKYSFWKKYNFISQNVL